MEYVDGPTPNGGAYAYVYFFDDEGKSSDKENGSNGHILEFDEKGKRIYETYFMIGDKSERTSTNINVEEIEVLNID